MIVFDSSAIIDFLGGGTESRGLIEREEKKNQSVGVTVISKYELLTPVFHRRLVKEEVRVRTFLRRSSLLFLDSDSAEEASKIMGTLLQQGIPVNALDALIAGIAVVNKADSIVTRDKDFLRVSEVTSVETILMK